MGNICEPYCSCDCNCENQLILQSCKEGCIKCLSCDGCQQCTECDGRMLNPCMIREASNKELNEVLKEFDFIGENEDKLYGDIQVLEHKVQKEIVILKMIENSSEQEAQQVYQSFIRRLKLNHENIIRLRYIVHKTVDAFCSVIYKNYLFFDYILTDLASEIKHRKKKELYFTEDEMWNMTYCLINAMQYFSNVNINHGCIKTKNIYINQYGQFKLADPALFNYEVSYDIIYSNRDANKGIILSPAQVIGLQKNIEKPMHDQQKTDVFCLGIVLLEAGTLLNSDSCFDYDQEGILDDKIQDRLNDVKFRYHDSLYYLLKEMVTINEVQRPDFNMLIEKSSRNPKFRFTSNYHYQQKAQFQIQNNEMSDIASNLNNSHIANKYQNNSYLAQNKSFDNVSVIHNVDNSNHLRMFSPLKISEIELGSRSHNYNIGGSYHQFGQYSMPSPMMVGIGVPGIGSYNIQSMNLSSTMDIASPLTAAKKGKEKICEKYKNGSRYEGEVKLGQRDGKGKYYYNNGGYFEGTWKDGKMDGQGTLYFPDGSTAFNGCWRQDQFHGYGTIYNNSIEKFSGSFDHKNFNYLKDRWDKFEGDFKNDLKDGFGTLYLSNGERFVGEFKGDKMHGKGTYYTKQNQIIKGRWGNNIML